MVEFKRNTVRYATRVCAVVLLIVELSMTVGTYGFRRYTATLRWPATTPTIRFSIVAHTTHAVQSLIDAKKIGARALALSRGWVAVLCRLSWSDSRPIRCELSRVAGLLICAVIPYVDIVDTDYL